MCSTPKPKRTIKAKRANNRVSILAAMNSEQRQRFSQRANQASDRRIEKLKRQREEQECDNKVIIKNDTLQKIKTKTKSNQSWLYWLLNAPVSELMRKLVS